MNLNSIIKNLKVLEIHGSTDIDISDIVYDSRKVTENCMFVCLKGCNLDGHKFIDKAVKNGAIAIVVANEVKIPGVTTIRVNDTRASLPVLSANFFEHPSKKITTIAITGTKGKTTTSFMIKSILQNYGKKVGLIGTIGVVMGENIISLENTTPESYEIQKYLHKMVQEKYEYVVIEASSIGLQKNRLDEIIFDIGVFTNISHDHIGGNEHKTYEEYLDSKSLLFQKCKCGIVNKDDSHLKEVIKNHTCNIQTFGMDSSANYYADNLKLVNQNSNIGISFSLKGTITYDDVFISVPGKFNVYNSLAAISVCHTLKIPIENILQGLREVRVKGRCESIPNSLNCSIFIDYAHNSNSMENILQTFRSYNPKRIVTLFGAGGNRPKIRRYEMGEICGKLSDFSVVTSDNPRFEDPLDIINDIKKGINKTTGKYIIIPDRRDAIKYCLENAQQGDIIIFAGKGHEEYQEINGVKLPFNEREIISNILKNLESKT